MATHSGGSNEATTAPPEKSVFDKARELDLGSILAKHHYIDVLDTASSWCLGEIASNNTFSLKIHYEGWSTKYDEDIKIWSSRLAPLRYKSRGYTGNPTFAIRSAPQISASSIKVQIDKLNKVTESLFTFIPDPLQFTQFMRGEAFVFADTLLTNCEINASLNMKTDLNIVYDYCDALLKCICCWIQEFPTKYAQNYAEVLNEPKLSLVSLKHAVAAWHPEMSEILKLLFGMSKRSEDISAKNTKASNEKQALEGSAGKKKHTVQQPVEKATTIPLSKRNAMAFLKLSGPELVLNLIKHTGNAGSSDNLAFSLYGTSLNLFLDLLAPTTYSLKFSQTKKEAENQNELKQMFLKRMQKMQDKDIKDFEKNHQEYVFSICESITDSTEGTIVIRENLFRILTQIAVNLIKSQYIQKKLLGVYFIKSFLPKSEKERAYALEKKKANIECRDPHLLAKLLNEVQFVDLIVGENARGELIRKIDDIFGIILSHNGFSASHLLGLWKCCTEKHEEVIRASFDCLFKLIKSLKPSHGLVTLLNEQIKKFPLNKYTEIMIGFMEKYALSRTDITSDMVTSFMEIFHNLTLDSLNLPGALKNAAHQALVTLIGKCLDLGLKQFVEKAYKNIKAGTSVARSIQLLMGLEYAKYNYDQKPNSKVFNLKQLNDEYCVIPNCIKDCIDFHKRLAKQIKEGVLENKGSSINGANTESVINKILAMEVLGSGIKNEQQSRLYIEFLEYHVKNSEVNLTIDDIDKLWNCYLDPIFEEQVGASPNISYSFSNQLFESLLKDSTNNQHASRRYLLIINKMISQVFQQFFMNKLEHRKITLIAFKCFKSYMMSINENFSSAASSSSAITSSIEHLAQKAIDNLEGFIKLWNIVLNCDNIKVKELAKEYLVENIEKLLIKNSKLRIAITEKALELALQGSESGSFNPINFEIIDAIIEKIECLKHAEITSNYFTQPSLEFTCIIKASGSPTQTKTIFISDNLKLRHLRNYISFETKTHLNFISIRNTPQGQEIEKNFDDNYLTHIHQRNKGKIYVELKKSNLQLKEIPRYILSNSACFGKLLDCLKSNNDAVLNEAWKLLLNLPLNEDMGEKIRKMEFEENKESPLKAWEEYLGVSGEKEECLAYYMHALDKLLNEGGKSEKEKFLKKKGFQFIYGVFIIKAKAGKRNKLNLKCIEFTLHLMSNLIKKDNFSTLLSAEDWQNLWVETMKIVGSISQKKEEGLESDKKKKQLEEENEADLIRMCFSVINKMCEASEHYGVNITKDMILKEIVKCLISHKNEKVQQLCQGFLKDICLSLFSSIKKVQKLVVTGLFSHLKMAVQCQRSSYYFQLMKELIISTTELDIDQLKNDKVLVFISEQIQSSTCVETSQKILDSCLSGLMEILKELLEKLIKSSDSKCKDLVMEIAQPIPLIQSLYDSLFLFGTHNPKCKNQVTRNKALLLLETLLSIYPSHSALLFTQLDQFHITGNWRTNRKSDWSIEPESINYSQANYVGLKNQGATCYMNSLLFQFYMMPQFRKGIIESECKDKNKEKSLLYQLQHLFLALNKSNRSKFNTKNFVQCVKIDGKYVSNTEQKDVDEFLIQFLEQLEQSLKGTSSEKLISGMMKMTLANELICKDCPHRSERPEEDITIKLDVKNKKTLHDCLRAFVKPDILEGDNAYLCEQCEKKVVADKRANLKVLPNTLILTLKRFEYNLETMGRYKLNDFCEFPHELNMEEFTQEGQARIDLMKDLESGKCSMEDLSDENKWLLKKHYPQEYYTYKLRGIVVHMGNSESGHYYSYIQDRENSTDNPQWFWFNDSNVHPFNVKDIPEETFGGENEGVTGINADFLKEKNRSAYILVYERVVELNFEMINVLKEVEKQLEPAEFIKRYEKCRIARSSNAFALAAIPEELSKIVELDNKKFWLSQYLFHPDYLQFITKLITKTSLRKEEEAIDYSTARKLINRSLYTPSTMEQDDPGKFAIHFLLTTALRAKKTQDLIPLYKHIINEVVKKSVYHSLYLANIFARPQILSEFISDCPNDVSRRLIGGLLKAIMEKLYLYEKNQLIEISNFKNFSVAKSLEKFAGDDKSTSTTSSHPTEPTTTAASPSVDSTLILKENHSLPYLFIMATSLIHQIPDALPYYCGQIFRALHSFASLGSECITIFSGFSIVGSSLEKIINDKKDFFNLIKTFFVNPKLENTLGIGFMTKEIVYPDKKQLEQKIGTQNLFIFEFVNYLYLRTEKCLAPWFPEKIANGEPTEAGLAQQTSESNANRKVAAPEKRILYTFKRKEEGILDLLLDPKTLDNIIIHSCKGSRACLTRLGELLQKITYKSTEKTTKFWNFINDKFAHEECDVLKYYFRIATLNLLSNDQCAEKVEYILKLIIDNFSPPGSFRILECFTDYLIKLCKRPDTRKLLLGGTNPKIKEAVKELANRMQLWVSHNPYPIVESRQFAVFRNASLQMTKELQEKYSKEFTPITSERLNWLNSIKKSNNGLQVMSNGKDEDIDEDIYTSGKKLIIGDEYDIYLPSKLMWTHGKVIDLTPEIANFQIIYNEEIFNECIEIESDRIAPFKSMEGNEEVRIHAEMDSNLQRVK